MQTFLKEEGTFRVYPRSWTVEQKDSGAACIAVELYVSRRWHPDEGDDGMWSAEWPEGYTVYMRSWVIKKNGELNEGAVKALVDTGIWDGDFDAIAEAPPAKFLIVSVKGEEYNGNVSYRADWPQPDCEKPKVSGTGFKPVDVGLLKNLSQRFGPSLRALGAGGGATAQPAAAPRGPAAPAAPGGPATNDAPAANTGGPVAGPGGPEPGNLDGVVTPF